MMVKREPKLGGTYCILLAHNRKVSICVNFSIAEAKMASSESEVKLLCVVKGSHIYKEMWEPYLGDDLSPNTKKQTT